MRSQAKALDNAIDDGNHRADAPARGIAADESVSRSGRADGWPGAQPGGQDPGTFSRIPARNQLPPIPGREDSREDDARSISVREIVYALGGYYVVAKHLKMGRSGLCLMVVRNRISRPKLPGFLALVKASKIPWLTPDICNDLATKARQPKTSLVMRRKKRGRNQKWQGANREKYLAHKAVENALLAGTLSRKPCERCGADRLIHAHHDDYSRPLDVMWLCPKHHRERHRELNTINSPACPLPAVRPLFW